MSKIQVSNSEIKTLQCPRKWYFQYYERYESVAPAESLLFGQVFHVGMATACKESLNFESDETLILRATVAANEALDDILMGLPPDHNISGEEFRLQLSNMYAYYIPLIGFNTKYRVARYWEVLSEDYCHVCSGFGHVNHDCPYCEWGMKNLDDPESECGDCGGSGIMDFECSKCSGSGYTQNDTPMVEYEFRIDVGHGITLHGLVDAFLIDIETSETVIVDWKTVKTPRNATQAMLDDQLHLYAAAFNYLGAKISRVIMWQMRKQTPNPAKINKDGKPSIASQTSTWNVWYNSLPPATKKIVDADRLTWEEWAGEKLNPEIAFNAPVENFISPASVKISLQNIRAQSAMIRYFSAIARDGGVIPAIADGGFSGVCMFCPFQSICVDAIRNGENYQEMLDEKFVKRS